MSAQSEEPAFDLATLKRFEFVLDIGAPPPHDHLHYTCTVAGQNVACTARVVEPPAVASVETDYRISGTIAGTTISASGYAKITSRAPSCGLLVIEFNGRTSLAFDPSGAMTLQDDAAHAEFTTAQACPATKAGHTYTVGPHHYSGSWRPLEASPQALLALLKAQQSVAKSSPATVSPGLTSVGQPLQPAHLSFAPNAFVPAFGTLAAHAARSAEDLVFVHVNYTSPDGRLVMVASPYITDGIINAAETGARLSMAAAETSARLSVAAAEAGANWVSKNPEAAAGLAVATAVSMLVPAAPIAAYVLGVSGEAAVVGTATEAMIGGVIASGTEAFVTTTLKEIGSDRSVGDKLRNIAGATGASALTSIPSSVVGANMTTILGQFVAQKTAGVVGGAAGKGVDVAIGALGVSDAAQQALTGQMPADGPPIKSGGVIIATSLSPQPGSK